jgi:hypothetical protein
VNRSETEERQGKTGEQESKTLLASRPRRQPSWPVWLAMKGFRLLFLTVLWSGLGMGVGLLTGIALLMTGAVIHQRMPPMDLAYRQIAIPTAIFAGGCALLWNLWRTVLAGIRRIR